MYRGIVVLVIVVAYLYSLVCIALLPSTVWHLIGFEQRFVVVFGLLVGFCLVCLSYWVWMDGLELDSLREMADEYKQRSKTEKELASFS